MPLAETRRAGYVTARGIVDSSLTSCRVCGDVAPPPPNSNKFNKYVIMSPAEAQSFWVETAVEAEHMLKVQEECLSMVVHLVTELPRIKTAKTSAAASGLEHHLAHCLAAAGSSGATRSELASQAAPYFAAQNGQDDGEGPDLEDLEDSEDGESGYGGGGSMPAGSDAALDAAIARVAVAPSSSSSARGVGSPGSSSGSGGRKFVLSAAGAALYDPCCPRLRRDAHTKATELVASLLRRQASPGSASSSPSSGSTTSSTSNQPWWRPVVGPPPPTAPVFGIGVRRAMLLSPTLQRMLGSVLRRHGNPKNWPVGIVVCDSKVWCEPLVLLVIHLLTLSVHECAENALESETPSSSSSAMKMDDASEGNEVRAVNKEDDRYWLHPSTLGMWDARSDPSARQNEARAFFTALSSPLTSSSEHESDPPQASLLSQIVDLWFAVRSPNSSSGGSGGGGGAEASDGDQGLLPPLHMQGLGWLFAEIGKRDPGCQSYLEARSAAAVEAGKAPLPGCAPATAPDATSEEGSGSSSGGSGGGGAAAAVAVPSAAERRAAAQARAMAAMKKSQMAFAATLDDADDDTDSDEDGGHGGSSSSRGGAPAHVAPALECCICRDSSSSSGGEGSASDVVAYMCLAQRSSMLGAATWRHFEKGEEGGEGANAASQLAVGVGASSDIFACGASQLTAAASALADNQSSGSSCTGGGGGGSSSGSSDSSSSTRSRQPAASRRLSWQQWGARRVHVQSCGHGVHPRCWEQAFVKDLTQALESSQNAAVAFDPRHREFLCPLCKVLCNTLVPYCAPPASSQFSVEPPGDKTQAAAPGSSPLSNLIAWANSEASSEALLSSETADSSSEAAIEASSSLQSAQTLFLDMLEEADNGGSSFKAAARKNKTSHASFLWTQERGGGTSWLLACSSLGYTLACLEATTRDNWAAPKAGSGFHASALQGMGLAIMHAATGASGGECPKYHRLQATQARALLCGSRSGGDGAGGGGGGSNKNSDDAQPPALTWDLTTLAVAALTAPAYPLPSANATQEGDEPASMSQGSDRIYAAQALVFLRLSQVLLEPRSTRSIQGGDTTAAAAAGAPAPLQESSPLPPLDELRAALAARAGVTVDLGAPSGDDLIEVVEENLTPFVLVVAFLSALLDVTPDDKTTTPASSKDEDALTARVSSVFGAGRDLCELLPLIGLHQDSSEALAAAVLKNPDDGDHSSEASCFSALMAPWANHLKAHVNAAQRTRADPSSDSSISDAAVATSPSNTPSFFFFGSPSSTMLPTPPVMPTFEASSLSGSLSFMPALTPLPKRFTDLFASVARALPVLEAAVHEERQRLKRLTRSPQGARANGAGGNTGSREQNQHDDDKDSAFSPSSLTSAAAVEDLEAPLDKLEPALCLITGQLLPAGLKLDPRNPRIGALTLHARTLSGGTGLYLLVNRSLVLAVRGAHAANLPHLSPYLDSYGEPDEGLVRGRPLFLDPERWAGLQRLYTNHRIGTEVSRLRATADRYIKDNYY